MDPDEELCEKISDENSLPRFDYEPNLDNPEVAQAMWLDDTDYEYED